MAKRLGRGLADIIESTGSISTNFVMLHPDQIKPNRFQPRLEINEKALDELKASIAQQGIIEPIVVRPVAHGTYELVAGERRLKAARSLEFTEVPTLIKSLTDKEALAYSLVENIQRESLNPIEEARGYARLLDEFGSTQEDIATAVGKDRATVANMLRLLKLPEEIQQGLSKGAISLGHAKVLLSIEGESRQVEHFKSSANGKMTVRQLEASLASSTGVKKRRANKIDPEILSLENQLREVLGTKVSLIAKKKGGRIMIDYFSTEDLDRILKVLGVA